MRGAPGLLLVAVVLAGCGSNAPSAGPGVAPPTQTPSLPASTAPPTPTTAPTVSHTPSPSKASSPTQATALGTVPPSWLGTRPLPKTAAGFGEQRPTPPELRNRRFTLPDSVPMLPGTGFASKVVSPAPAAVIARSTWGQGCPVKATDLAWLRLTFRGFDHRRHTGELLVNRSVTEDLVSVFRKLYAAGFPIEQMKITTRSEQKAGPTGDGNDTESFNCRPVVGATVYSQHAYGLAVDVNPFQNPYEKGDVVLPELAGSYTDRSWQRPGMIYATGPVVRAFRDIGWGWGGAWHSLKDIQHFSQNDR